MGIGNENKGFITASADALINWVR
ncbi:NADH-quinone oxidoreductase subunit B, partial [Francisella tularensis subsp. holarctica]|nr:NADH-quinone oxidoreductase subunit B [Francisella tularensis subsp. holarctica]